MRNIAHALQICVRKRIDAYVRGAIFKRQERYFPVWSDLEMFLPDAFVSPLSDMFPCVFDHRILTSFVTWYIETTRACGWRVLYVVLRQRVLAGNRSYSLRARNWYWWWLWKTLVLLWGFLGSWLSFGWALGPVWDCLKNVGYDWVSLRGFEQR